MKTTSFLFATALSVVAAQSNTTATSEPCDGSALSVILMTPSFPQCSTESQYDFMSLKAAPTKDELAKMCKSEACVNLISLILGADPKECTIPIGGGLQLRAQLLDLVASECKALGVTITPDAAGAAALIAGANGSSSSNGTKSVEIDPEGKTASSSSKVGTTGKTPAPTPSKTSAATILTASALGMAAATFMTAWF